MKEILKEFEDEVCSTCKGECHRGITFIMNENTEVKCVDYIKDETKIKKPEKQLVTTAKQQKPVMRDLV